MDDVLRELADRLHIPEADIISADEVRDWPEDKLDEFVSEGILREVEPAKTVVCDECPENCTIEPDLRTNPKTGQTSGIYICTRNPDVGRIEIDLSRLRRWRINGKKLAQFGYRGKAAKSTKKQTRKEKKESEVLLLHSALLTHHRFGTGQINFQAATQKDLGKLTGWKQPKVHRVMRAAFGKNPMDVYKRRCRDKTIMGFLRKGSDGRYDVEAVDDSGQM